MSLFTKTHHRPNPVDPIRFRGHRGGVIPMHRALTQFRIGLWDVVNSSAAFVLFFALWVMLLPWVCDFWKRIFSFALSRLEVHARLELASYHLGFLRLSVPCLRMEPVFPTFRVWTASCAVTVLLFVATFFVPRRWLPIIYLGRTILLVHVSALVYFALLPAGFPHTPNSYLQGLITASLGLISIIPLLFALTYYIFDFHFLKKAAITVVTMAHLTVFVPFQVLLQALVLEKSILYMPVLYIIFAVPVDILIIIAFYSWGMTWSFREARA